MSTKNRILNNHILAICIGLVYFWFGILKFFPEYSPAEQLAKNTMNMITFNLIPADISIIILAIWETLAGLLLVMNIYRRSVVVLMLIHITCTFIPIFFFSNQSFINPPFVFTLLGQYIFKNIIIIGALLTLYKLPSTTYKNQDINSATFWSALKTLWS